MRLHTGIDLVPFESLVVYSCSDGRVASIDIGTVMGDVITVEHANNIFIRYCGVKNIKVSVNDTVTADTPLAEVGTVTGECAEQAHLHLEVLENSEIIDPSTIIF
jgi:murein DD-endopeptidase MepM/ murein hydrolase activator NlpD